MLIFPEIKATGRLLNKIHVCMINIGCPLALVEPYFILFFFEKHMELIHACITRIYVFI